MLLQNAIQAADRRELICQQFQTFDDEYGGNPPTALYNWPMSYYNYGDAPVIDGTIGIGPYTSDAILWEWLPPEGENFPTNFDQLWADAGDTLPSGTQMLLMIDLTTWTRYTKAQDRYNTNDYPREFCLSQYGFFSEGGYFFYHKHRNDHRYFRDNGCHRPSNDSSYTYDCYWGLKHGEPRYEVTSIGKTPNGVLGVFFTMINQEPFEVGGGSQAPEYDGILQYGPMYAGSIRFALLRLT